MFLSLLSLLFHYLLTDIEMPYAEQLLHTNVDHLRPRNGTNPQTGPDVGADQCTDIGNSRTDATVDGEHEELWRISRDPSLGEPALHSILR